MDGRVRNRWATALLVGLVAIGVGIAAYNFGVSHGLALGGQAAGGAPGAPPMYPYGWHRPWGLGFGFFFPFLFFGFWFLAALAASSRRSSF